MNLSGFDFDWRLLNRVMDTNTIPYIAMYHKYVFVYSNFIGIGMYINILNSIN